MRRVYSLRRHARLRRITPCSHCAPRRGACGARPLVPLAKHSASLHLFARPDARELWNIRSARAGSELRANCSLRSQLRLHKHVIRHCSGEKSISCPALLAGKKPLGLVPWNSRISLILSRVSDSESSRLSSERRSANDSLCSASILARRLALRRSQVSGFLT